MRYHVGPLSDFPIGKFRIFVLGARSVGVVRTERGFYGVLNYCPHQGAEICGGHVRGTMVPSKPGTFDYNDDRLVIVCPWHRWEFDLATGRVFGHTTRKRLLTFDVQLEDDQVYVMAKGRGTAAREVAA